MNCRTLQRGFTLIQISILLLVASMVLVAVLPSTRTNLNANNDTTTKMNAILSSLREFEATNARLPCPADASLPIGNTNYGVAAANPGTPTTGGSNCGGATPAANYTDSTNNIAIGMVPVKTLGLSNDFAQDAYGRDITYAVDTNATVCFSGTLTGKITVNDNGTANSTITALVSHGADGHGAWIPLTGTTGTAVRLNVGSTDTDQHTVNAHGITGPAFPANYASINTSVTTAESTTANFVRKLVTATFDDLVVYKSNLWNINAAPLSTSDLIPSIAAPANGSYYTTQTLSFTLTWGGTVAVTGSPELKLTIPQQGGSNATRYATYYSTSGNTVTFRYQVQSTDYAPTSPTSVAMAQSSVILNGGTITQGGATACLNFTAPSLTGVLLNPLSIYVMDFGNYRVEKFTNTGTFVTGMGAGYNGAAGSIGTSGCGNGQFTYMGGLALDSSGNVWVTEAGCGTQRIDEFNSSGVYQGQVAIPSTGCARNLSIDGSNNFWVSEGCASYARKYSSGGTLLLTLAASAGGVAIDGLGNIWVAGGNEVQEFASSGGTALQTITGLNQDGGITMDPGGNIWVSNPNTPAETIVGSSAESVGSFGFR